MKKFLILLLCLFAIDSFASGIASNTNSAPCTNTTLETYSGNSNLAADWQPNTINLSWYNEDEKLTVQQSAQSCVYDGGLTIPSTQPTRTGYTFAGWTIRIPGTYTELEYVHFDGTSSTGAYVDTGLKFYTDIPTNKIRFVADAKVYQNNNWQVIVGNVCRSDYVGIRYDDAISYGNSSGNDRVTNISNPFERCVFDLDLISGTYTVNKVSNNAQIVNISGIGVYVLATSLPILLGGYNYYDDLSVITALRTRMDLYNVKIYNNGELVFNGIPAKRNSDNVVGIYDTVSQTFKTNVTGTNALTAGPVVQ